MRLTLRTLLAYLDDILEPEDAEKLREKIEENPNASELVHRIRTCMSNSRLQSPAVHGRGSAANANSVSEYLDNTLPVERMPEFERTCLESDVHLSEVAACHQILTMVLGEPAEVENGLRKRAYALNAGSRTAEFATSQATGTATAGVASNGFNNDTGSTAASASTVSSSVAATSVASEEYHDAADSPRNFVWPVALMLIAGFLITTAVLTGMRWFSSANEVAINTNTTNQATSPPVVGAEGSSTTSDAPAKTNLSAENPRPVAPVVEPFAVTPPAEPVTTLPLQPLAPPADPPAAINEPATPPPAIGDSAPTDIASAPTDLAPAPTSPPKIQPPANVATPPVDVATAAPETPAASVAPPIAPPPLSPMNEDLAATAPPLVEADPPAQPQPEQLADNRAHNAIGDAVGMEGGNIKFDGDDAIDEPADPKPVSRDIARSVVEDQAMAIWDPEKQAWLRLGQRQPLQVDQRFRNLPTFRPQLLLVGGLQMTLDGSCDFSLGEPQEIDMPVVNFAHGRALYTGLGQAPSRVALNIAGRMITIQQGDPDSEFAVEVVRTRTPGSNIETATRHHVVKIWPVSGRIGIREAFEGAEEDGEQKTLAVEAGQMWVAIDKRAAVAGDAGQIPKWALGPKLRDIDQTALLELEPLLTPDRSLTLSLLEASKHRRSDVQSLASRCLAALGRFEPIIESLGDQKQHSHWEQHVRQLRSAINRHPESAALVAQSLRRVTGPDAERMLQLLGSFSPSQLTNGGASYLIDSLENESLEVRVAASETLKHITGMSQLFRADRPASQRQVAVRKWRGRLEDGNVVYAEQPLIFSGDEEATPSVISEVTTPKKAPVKRRRSPTPRSPGFTPPQP